MEEEIKEDELKEYAKQIRMETSMFLREDYLKFILIIIIGLLGVIMIIYFDTGILITFVLILPLLILFWWWWYIMEKITKNSAKIMIQKDRKIAELENKLKQLIEQQSQEEKKKLKKK